MWIYFDILKYIGLQKSIYCNTIDTFFNKKHVRKWNRKLYKMLVKFDNNNVIAYINDESFKCLFLIRFI